jgi:hypothetical protein
VVTTSIGLPQKAFNIRRSPQVAMLFSDPTASGLTDPPQILVQGTASCPDDIDTDPTGLSDYWTKLMQRQPSSKLFSSVVGRRLMDFYYLRLIIGVAPVGLTERPPLQAETRLLATSLPRSERTKPFGQVAGNLPGYRSGVLAAFDDAGRPTLLRVQPTTNRWDCTLEMDVPDGVDLRPGAASLLCHSHDEKLSSQKSFVVAGKLQQRHGKWTLSTDRFVPGAGSGGPLSIVTAIRNLRSTAARYLERRGLERPAVNWAGIDELWRTARAAATSSSTPPPTQAVTTRGFS